MPNTDTGRQLHIHLVSDATGETLNSITRACLVQFERAHPIEHHWTLIRTTGQMDKVLAGIEAHPGLVLFTVINDKLRQYLLEGCRQLGVKFVSVLDPIINALTDHFGQAARGGAVTLVAARDGVAQVVQDLGDAAHAGAPDAHEMDVLDGVLHADAFFLLG